MLLFLFFMLFQYLQTSSQLNFILKKTHFVADISVSSCACLSHCYTLFGKKHFS